MDELTMSGSKITQHLVWPRYFGWIIRLLLTFWFGEWFGLTHSSDILGLVFGCELVYLLLSHWQISRLYKFNDGLFWILLIDTLFWIAWLYLTGGSTNAFVSFLLVPIAIAAIALPEWNAWVLSLINCVAYSLMLYFSPETEHMMHMNMSSHYLGMWLNFILSTLVINSSLLLISKKLRHRDFQLSQLRESQLKQEQLVALGASSAQMAHQLATPLCSMRLWLDDLKEEYSQQAVEEVNSNLSRCEHSLMELRLATEAIRDGKKQQWAIDELVTDLKRKTQLLLPEHEIKWLTSETFSQSVFIDHGVLPALITLMDNAGKASYSASQKMKLEVSILVEKSTLNIIIRDFGAGIDPKLSPYLGKQFVPSEKGLGIALMLTHASLERNAGRLSLRSHPQTGCIAKVILPIEETKK
ncbi:MAG: sensor histidine kinase [Parashewanella sp.]